MKIRIIGPVGSGKTTFANALSKQTGIPVTALDTLNWHRMVTGDVHKTPAERQTELNHVLRQNHWIIEGTQYRHGQAVFCAADIIYVLDVPLWLNIFRLITRWLDTRMNHGPRPYQQIWPYVKWLKQWYRYDKLAVLALLTPYRDKVKIVKAFDKIKTLE